MRWWSYHRIAFEVFGSHLETSKRYLNISAWKSKKGAHTGCDNSVAHEKRFMTQIFAVSLVSSSAILHVSACRHTPYDERLAEKI